MSYPESGESSGRDDSSSFGRRTCLRGIGGLATAAGAAGAFSEEASAATTRRGIRFDRVVNVVDDLGLDPNGNEAVQWKLNNADQEGTLFVFPEGEYRVTGRILMLFRDAVGMVGRGNVRFKVPKWYNDLAVVIDHGQRAIFENIDIDLRARGATPGCRFGGYDDVQVHNVEFLGQGRHGGSQDVTSALAFMARDGNANVLAENVVARNKGQMGAYNRGNGRVGVWVGQSHKGALTLRNCHISGFPNNGLYTSRTPGVVQVEGGVYRNNDISQVRLGSEGSYVKDALIEVDPSKSDSRGRMLNARGVRIESGPIDTAGVTVENCDIRIASGAPSQGGVVAARPAGMFDVVDTRIRVDADRTHAILGEVPDGGAYDTPPWPHRARLVNVSVTGNASKGTAIELKSRPESVVRSCCVEQRSADRDGVKLVNSNRTVVGGSTLNVSGNEVETQGTNAKQWGISTNGSCPTPGSGGASTSGAGGSGGSGSNGSDDSGSNRSGNRKRIEIRGDDKAVEYWVKVSGDIRRTDSLESNDDASGDTASGWVSSWVDAFSFTGHVEKIVVRRDAAVTYERNGGGTPGAIRFHSNSTGHGLEYTASVTGDMWRNGTTEGSDSLWTTDSGDKVNGWFSGWDDSYRCNGDLRSASIEGVCEITVDN